MNRHSPFWAILVVMLISSGCGFFKRDIKTTSEALEDGGVAFDQQQSMPNAGPSEGMVALEQATEGGAFTSGQDLGLRASNAPLPPREPDSIAQAAPTRKEPHADPWAGPEPSQSGYASPEPASNQVAGTPPIEGPSIPPQPEGKPVASSRTSFKDIPDFQPKTATQPITQTNPFGDEPILGSSIDGNPLLADTGKSFENSLRSEMNQSFSSPGFQSLELNSPPPGIQGNPLDNAARALTEREAAATKDGLDLAGAIHPSGLAGPEAQAQPPQPGFQPLAPETLAETSLLGNQQTIDQMGASLKGSAEQPQRGFQPLPPESPSQTGPETGNAAPAQTKPPEATNRNARHDFGPSATEIPPPRKPAADRQEEKILLSQTAGKNDLTLARSEADKPAGNAPNEVLPDAETLKELGIKQYKASRFDEAIQTFRKYLGAYPDENQEIQWRMAQALFQSNRWGDAETEFDKLRGSPRPEFRADAILKLGLIDQIRGDKDGARQHWKNVVDNYPKTDAATRASKLLAETP